MKGFFTFILLLFTTCVISQNYFGLPVPATSIHPDDYNYNNFGTPLAPGNHTGKDFAGAIGMPIIAVGDGVVVFVEDETTSNDHGLGRTVIIEHILDDGNGTLVYSQYSHLQETDKCVGWYVKKGDVIGKLGQSAYGCESHSFGCNQCRNPCWDLNFNGVPDMGVPINYDCTPPSIDIYTEDIDGNGVVNESDCSGHLHLEFKTSLYTNGNGYEVCGNQNTGNSSTPPCGYTNDNTDYGFRNPDNYINTLEFIPNGVSFVCPPPMLPQVGATLPDIYLSNTTLSDNDVAPNQSVTITTRQHLDNHTHANISSSLEYWFSDDLTLDGGDILLGTDGSSIGIDPDDNESLPFNVPNVSNGVYYIILKADANDIISPELSDQNNLVGIALSVSSVVNQINLTLYQSSITGNANENKIISGYANYDDGTPVKFATITISTSNSQYTTTTDFNGNFSKAINLPPNSGIIQVEINDGSFTDVETINVSINSGSSGNGYSILNYTTCFSNDVNVACQTPIAHFKHYNDRVHTWIEIDNITTPVQTRMIYYRPDGTEEYNYTSNFSTWGNPAWYFYSYIGINGFSASDLQGTWTVEIFAREQGTTWQYVDNLSFVLSHVLAEHKMCKSVVNDFPVNETNTFYQNDSDVFSWAHYTDQCNGLDLKVEWYEPNGSLYLPHLYTLSDPGSAPQAWVPDRYQWMSMSIDGYDAANKTGEWSLEYYSKDPFGNWDLEYTDQFQILESPNVLPTTNVSVNPTTPVEGQNITLNVNASDNTYLSSVKLFYNIGSGWLNQCWDNLNIGTFSNNFSLGNFAEGDEIQFYVEATDNSGNISNSTIQTITIGDSDTSPPSITNVTVSELSGNNDGYFQETEILTFSANVTDPSGISSIEYYVDGQLHTSNTNYYPGDHELIVIAYDNDTSPEGTYVSVIFHVCDNLYFVDNDGDGYGGTVIYDCTQQSNYVTVGGDCNDFNSSVYTQGYWYEDTDGDGLGNPSVSLFSCNPPTGYVIDNTDCNDSDPYNCCSDLLCTNFVYTTNFYDSYDASNTNILNFHQNCTDDTDWEVHSGSTTSSNTGPSAALNPPNYIYIESSSPNYPNKKAILESNCFNLSSFDDPAFWILYSMYGACMGSLEIQVLPEGSNVWESIHLVSGNQGTGWNADIIFLTQYVNQTIKIRIIGTTGSCYTSDIAIDGFYVYDYCLDTRTVSGTPNPGAGNTYYFEADQHIISDAKLVSGNIIFDSGGDIECTPNFEVQLGVDFETRNDGCDTDPYSIIQDTTSKF